MFRSWYGSVPHYNLPTVLGLKFSQWWGVEYMFSGMWCWVALLVLPDVSNERTALFYNCHGVQEDDEVLEMSGTANPGNPRYISKYQIAIMLTSKTSCFVFLWFLCDQTFPHLAYPTQIWRGKTYKVLKK